MSNPYPGQYPPPPYGHPVPPQPPKKNSVGKIIGIGCGGLVGLSVLLAACGALMAGGDAVKDGEAKGRKAAAAPPAADPAGPDPLPAPVKAAAPEVELTASTAEFRPTLLSEGRDFTSVRVTVTNNGDEEVSVNVLYFEVTAQDGTRRSAELAAAEDQIDTVQLARGEKVTGTVTVKGKLAAKTVHFKNGLLGKTYSAPVR
ncbi:DUF4352 domain-containing protein [Streptomyces sp. NPDC048507]|uniref:DUF4352 domain-containing protein n=1 Tax=Streptomyces sp. NPDC048507 TaxID=3365560 RepID=UPI0037223A32